MTEVKIQKHTYMPGLDGLRALAVFAVIAYHLNLPFVPGGFLGVTLFFVLSGYLITDLLLSEWRLDGKLNFKRFFIRRAKRLLPSVLFMLIFLSAYVTIFHPELLATLKTELLPSALFFSNWWNIFTDVPYFGSFATPRLLTHFWSLGVEAQFYVVWPFLLLVGLRFIKRKWLRIAITAVITVLSALLMAALFSPGADPSRVYYGTDTRAFALLLGALLAFILPSVKLTQPEQKKRTLIVTDIVGFTALASILFMSYYITQYDDFLYYGGMFVFSVASTLLIGAAANPSTVIGKVFGLKPLRFIGRISYGIYLWHFPVIALTNTWVPATSINAVLCVFQVAVSILLAAGSYYLIENPIRRSNILESFKSRTFKDFGEKCLRARWRVKTAVLLVFAFIIISSVGFIRPQFAPAALEEELSALPSALIIVPPENSVPSAVPAIQNPIQEASPSPTGGHGGTADPEQSAVPPVESPIPSDESVSSVSSSAEADGPEASDSASPDPSDCPGDGAADEITPSNMNVTLIGDSIGIDIAPYLQTYFPNLTVDAKVSRQFSEAENIVSELIQADKLGPAVVIELGSNGTIYESHLRDLIDLIGKERNIVFINIQVPRSWCEGNNATLTKVCAEYANVAIADWYSASIDKDDYFYSDDVHPNSTGSPVLAKIVYYTVIRSQLDIYALPFN